MANDNEFIIEVGAQIKKGTEKELAREFSKRIKNNKQITQVSIEVNFEDKAAKNRAKELKKQLGRELNKGIKIEIIDLDLKGITNFQKRIEELKSKLKRSGLNELSREFRQLESTINSVKNAYQQMSNASDFSGLNELHMKLNTVEKDFNDMVRAQRQEQIETSKANSAIKAYEQELNKLIQLKVKLAKAENTSKNKNGIFDVNSMNKYINSLKEQIKEQDKVIESTRKNAEAQAGAERTVKIYEAAQRKLKTSIASANLEQKKQVGFLQNIKNGFKDAVQNVSSYTLAYSSIQLAVQQVRKSIDIIIELDKAMVDLQIVTNATREQVHDMMQEYNQMAIKMGRSTKTVATSANEFLRMGYSASEANELIKQSLTLSTLGMIDAAEATDYMISAMKGYGVEVKNVSEIIDMATELDMKYSISSGYIMEAMSRTAASAKLAGSEMSELMAMISIVGETTKKSPEVVGEAMKTMYARYGNVKINKFEDSDNPDEVEGINDIERVLNRLGIAIRNSGGEWRDYSDVMAEVGSRFNDLTDLEQNAIATAMFGTRQRENGIVILTNWNRVLEANEIALNASGTSEERMAYYTEGLGAAIERVGAAWERFLISLGDNQGVINIVNFIADIVELLSNPMIQKILLGALVVTSVEKIISVLGKLALKTGAFKNALVEIFTSLTSKKTLLVSLTKGIGEYSKSMSKAGLITKEASKSIIGSSGTVASLALKFAGLTAAILAVYGAYKAFDYFHVSYEEQKEELEAISKEYEKVLEDIDNVNDELKTTAKRIDELNGKDSLTLVEKDELTNLKETNEQLKLEKEYLEAVEKIKNKEKYITASDTFDKFLSNESGFKSSGGYFEAQGRTFATKGEGNYEPYWRQQVMDNAYRLGIKGEYDYFTKGYDYSGEQMMKGYINLYKIKEKEFDEASKDLLNAKSNFTKGIITEKELKEFEDKKSQLETDIGQLKNILINYNTELEETFGEYEYFENPTTDYERNINKAITLMNNLKKAIVGEQNKTLGDKVSDIKTKYSDLIKTLSDFKNVNEDVLNLSEYKSMVDEFKALGYTLPDIITELGYGADSVKDNKDNIEEYTAAMSSAVASLSDFADKVSTLDSIISNLQEGGVLSADDVSDLASAYPELTDELYDYLYGQISEKEILEKIKKLRKDSVDEYIDKLTDAYIESSEFLSLIYDENKVNFDKLGVEYDKNKNKFVISNLQMAKAAIKYAGVSRQAWLDATNDFLDLPWMTAENKNSGEDSVYISNGELYVHRHVEDGYDKEINLGKDAADIKKKTDLEIKELEKKEKEVEENLNDLLSKKDDSKDPYLEAFEKWYNDLKHMLNMDEITQKEYYDRLEQKNLEYFANKKEYQEEYDKYEEEVYKGRKTLWKKAFDDELAELKKQLDRKIINEEQYLKAYKELNDRYFKDNPVFKDEYDKGEAEIYNLGIERIENEYDRWIALHEDHINDMDYYNKWSLQQKLNYIAQEMSAMEKLYANNEILAEKFAETQRELQKQLYDTSKELAQQNLDVHDAYLEYVNNVIDKEVEALEEKKEALEEENDERKQAIELAELEEKLASAKRNKVLIYRKGQGFVYEQDQTAVNEAQKEIDEYLYEREKEKRIDAIQDEIDAWEDYRDEWNRTVEAYNEEQTRLTALMYEGYASEKDILRRRTDLIEDYADSYAKAAKKVAEASQMINSGIYDFEYDPDTGEFTTSSKGDYYAGGSGIGDSVYSAAEYVRNNYIGNSGETWAILPSGNYVKVNVNDKDKVTDSIPVGSTVVNANGAWTVTGGTAGAYEAVEVKKTSSSSGGGSSGGGSKGSGSSNITQQEKDHAQSILDNYNNSNKSNQQKYLESLVSKGSSDSASATDKGNAEWAKQELAAGKYAKGTTGTLSDEIAEVGEEGRELRILPKGTGVVPNPATETLMKFADNPAAFINSLSLPVMSSAFGGEHTEVFNISGITVNANNAEEFIKSLKGLKNKAIQKTSKRN